MTQVTIDEVPLEVRRSVEVVERYFHSRGVRSWALGGLQARQEGSAPEAPARVVDATHDDLYRALPKPFYGNVGSVGIVVQQLGLCCLGNRLVRLRLPNDRIIRVTLE